MAKALQQNFLTVITTPAGVIGCASYQVIKIKIREGEHQYTVGPHWYMCVYFVCCKSLRKIDI